MTALCPCALVAVAWLAQAGDTDDVPLSRLAYLREQAARHVLVPAAESQERLTFVAEPVLRYTSPSGPTSDAAIFVWLMGGRPQIVGSFSIRRPGDEVVRELASFGSVPLECRIDGRAVWSPSGVGGDAHKLADAPLPAESKAQRLTQMRNLARRFSGRRYNWRETDVLELRLMATPLYRFEASEQGILDGAIFTFAKGTDPEVLLLLEAVAGAASSESSWQYTLARMSSQKQVMRLDDREIWSVPLYSRGLSAEEKRTGHYNEATVGKFRARE